MDQDHRTRYLRRMQRALSHAETHLDQSPDLRALAQAASFSPYHFHRQFRALFGVTVHQYVHAVRMKKAAWGLAFRPGTSITDWALACGYATPEAFSRAFRQYVGASPTQFRNEPDWPAWFARHAGDQAHPETTMRFHPTLTDVQLVDFPTTTVALLEHRGDPQRLGDTIRSFIAWRRANGVTPPASATFNLLYCDPWSTPPEEFRLALCAATAKPVTPNSQGVVAGQIPGGRCAVLRQTGTPDDLRPGLDFLFGTWLPQSGETLRDAPVFAQRVHFFPDVPESEAITDLFLPLQTPP